MIAVWLEMIALRSHICLTAIRRFTILNDASSEDVMDAIVMIDRNDVTNSTRTNHTNAT